MQTPQCLLCGKLCFIEKQITKKELWFTCDDCHMMWEDTDLYEIPTISHRLMFDENRQPFLVRWDDMVRL